MAKTKYTLKKVILIVSFPLLIGGCNDLFTQDDNTFKGKDQVEFKPITNTIDARADINDNPVMVSALLQLISSKGTLNSDITIQFAVDDSSTAVLGADYNITSTSPLTITSGEVSTELTIEVTADHLNDGDRRILYVSQKSINKSDVISSENYKTYTLIIRGVGN